MTRPSSRRQAVLDAAITLLGTGGSRALTHRAVDEAAGVPAGTTSNHFRTRATLVSGALAHLGTAEAEVLAGSAAEPAEGSQVSEADVLASSAAMLAFLAGPGRTLALARHALMLEAARDEQLQAELERHTQRWWDIAARWLGGAGAADPRRAGRTLLACLDGLLVDQLARPNPDFDPISSLAPVVRGLLDDHRTSARLTTSPSGAPDTPVAQESGAAPG